MMKVPGLRSSHGKVGGIVFFGRMLDQIRLHAAGRLPVGYNLVRVCRLPLSSAELAQEKPRHFVKATDSTRPTSRTGQGESCTAGYRSVELGAI